MNRTLMLSFLRQRFTSPGRVVLLFMIFAIPLAMLAATRGAAGTQILGTAGMFTFVLGAGMIGGDASSGVFQLLFARPVSRVQYLMSRWLAVGLGAMALHLLQLLLAALIMSAYSTLDSGPALARFAIEQGLGAFALAAVIAAFSSVLPGIGDVVGLIAAQFTLTVMQGAASIARQELAGRVIAEVQRTFSPEASWAAMFGGPDVGWRSIVTLASIITLALALASIAICRREITYASD